MVQVLDPSSKQRFASQFAQSLGGNIGQGLGEGMLNRMADTKQKRLNEAEDEALERLTGKNLRGLSPEIKRTFSERLAKSPEHEKIREALIAKGVPEQDADLYTMLTTGGQTSFINDLLESQKREQSLKNKLSKGLEPAEDPSEHEIDQELEDILASQDEGLLPSEIVAREKERFTHGAKAREEATTKLRGLARDKERLNILKDLGKSKKLPEDLGRLNLDKEGNLRLPFAASPEAQRFVKTLNEFSANAKDTYGSRVTNFDLQQYMKRFPTLMNSQEGREQIIKQMEIVNDINSIYYKNLQDIYRKSGGARKIDSDVAQDLAERRSEVKISQLSEKFNEIGKMTSLPSASEFQGRKIRNPETGEILVSDGQNWVPLEE